MEHRFIRNPIYTESNSNLVKEGITEVTIPRVEIFGKVLVQTNKSGESCAQYQLRVRGARVAKINQGCFLVWEGILFAF